MFKKPKMPAPAAPPPPPKPIPTATAPGVRESEIEAARKGRKMQGRQSTLMQGSLGDGIYTAPDVAKTVLLG